MAEYLEQYGNIEHVTLNNGVFGQGKEVPGLFPFGIGYVRLESDPDDNFCSNYEAGKLGYITLNSVERHPDKTFNFKHCTMSKLGNHLYYAITGHYVDFNLIFDEK